MARDKEEIKKFLLEDRLGDSIKLGTVSGVFTTKPALIRWIDENVPEILLITTKSYQVNPNLGNSPPIIAELAQGCFGNAVGLRNPGMDVGYAELSAMLADRPLRSLLNISLSADNIDDFKRLIRKFEGIADILELNFSCPHAKPGFGASIGSDVKVVSEYIGELRKTTDALLFPKLTPNVNNIGEIAKAAIDAGADGITAVNTFGPTVFVFHHNGVDLPILYNPNGHKGGRSGRWIAEPSLESIAEIRKAIGDNYPVIGMGGVFSGSDIIHMKEAGANAVCLGTVFALIKRQDLIPEFFSSLMDDARNQTSSADHFLSKGRIAEYKPCVVKEINELDHDLRIIKLDKNVEYEAGQYGFLWIPGIGERPFSITGDNDITFLIRRRDYDPENKKGLVTNGLFELKVGDDVMFRGPYGASPMIPDKNQAVIVAGGTGLAVVPRLAENLNKNKKEVIVFHGVTDKKHKAFKEEISQYGLYIPVVDRTTKGEVLNTLKNYLNPSRLEDSCFYFIGPPKMMKKGMDLVASKGVSLDMIYASVETNTMCGVGMCGECVCDDTMLCKQGTFVSLQYITDHKVDIIKLLPE